MSDLSVRSDYGFLFKLYVFFVIGIFLPAELFVSPFGVRMELYRVALILFFFLLYPLILKIKLYFFEQMLVCYCLWGVLSFLYIHGSAGLESGVIQFLEVFVSYFLGRTIIMNLVRLDTVIKVWATIFVLMLPFAILENLNGYRLLHVFASHIAGTSVVETLGEDYYRNGVYRSSVSFSHPILFSVGAAFLFVTIFYMKIKFKKIYILTLGTSVLSAMSSVGFLMIGIQFSIVAAFFLDKKLVSFRFSRFLIIFLFSSIFIIEALSNRGFVKVLLSALSLNPQTSYMRYLQWEFAIDDVLNNPIMGIGFNDWSRPVWMPSSIDNYWLLTALTNGMVALFFLILFWIGLIYLGVKAYKLSGDFKIVLLLSSTISLIVAGMTVDFFDRAHIYVYLFMGIFSGYFTLVKKINE